MKYSWQHTGRVNRATVAKEIRMSGKGLHSGLPVHLKIIPTDTLQGLHFRHAQTQSTITVSPYNVIETQNAVTLGNGQFKVQTVEHLLAALAASGITDAILEVDATEIPIMDGSGQPFFEEIEKVGVADLGVAVEPIRLTAPIWVVDHDRYLVALPSEIQEITCSIDFNHPQLKGQSIATHLNGEAFVENIISARTFGFLKDVEALKAKGLIQGAGVENALVYTDEGTLNEARYHDESVRHKVLDIIGDLYLLGRPVVAHLLAHRSGHALDVALARKILNRVAMDEIGAQRVKAHKGTPVGAFA